MSDLGHEQTDKELKRIENLISKEYSQAAHELEEKMKKHYADFDRKDAEMKKQKDSGKITDTQYNNWRVGQIAIGERWKSVRDSMVDTLVNTDKTAMKIIQGNSIKAYGDNMNYGTYEVEHGAKINTGFTLYDENTVKNLLKDDPKIIPLPKDDIPKDERWNRQKLTSAVTQGILQGESIPGIAKRLSEVAMMDKNSAIRNARTYTTAAENKGRIDSYERAESLGIKTNKKWIATLDDRTRAEHRHLDNMSVPYDEDFEVDGYKIGYPGDPSAEPEMFYNCRCTLVADIIGYEQIAGTEYRDVRNDEKLGDMTYEEWKHAKDKESSKDKENKAELPSEEDKNIIDKMFDGTDIDKEKAERAINEWAMGEAYDIREHQRNGVYDKSGEYMESLIKKSNVHYEGGPLYRGLMVDDAFIDNLMESFEEAEEDLNLMDMLGTSSWTEDKDIATKFAEGGAAVTTETTGDVPLVLKISEMGKNDVAIDIDEIAGLDQSEILISMNAMLDIEDVRIGNDGICYVELTYLGRNDKNQKKSKKR